MIGGTLSRYFGLRFLNAVIAVFVGAMTLVAMIDFLEMLRRSLIDCRDDHKTLAIRPVDTLAMTQAGESSGQFGVPW